LNTVPILMYHNLGTPPKGAKVKGLYVKRHSFEWQMSAMKFFGYKGLSMGELKPYLQGTKQGKVFGITFDDGYYDNLALALPILQKYNHSATCYFVSNRLGEHNIWDAEKLNVKKPIMSSEQMLKWHSSGMEVGAHTRHHVRLTSLESSKLKDEIQGCKEQLEDILGKDVKHFCYPWGDVNQKVIEATKDAGYETATTTSKGRATKDNDLFSLPRVHVMRNHNLFAFLMKIMSRYGDKK